MDTPYKVGDTVKTSIEMDLYPKPEPRNLVWVIEDPQQVEEKIELQPGTVHTASFLFKLFCVKTLVKLIVYELEKLIMVKIQYSK